VRRYIDMAKRSTDRATVVMQRLLGFSRQRPVDPRPVDVNELVREMGELLDHSLAGSLSVRTILGHDVGVTVIDEGGFETSIALRDTGMGMSTEVVTRACDPFVTTKAPGEGTGLGLAQVRDFVRQSGGHIAIESESGVGTTVRLHLPYPPPLTVAFACQASQIHTLS
jgi:signal transduction histidine kinase